MNNLNNENTIDNQGNENFIFQDVNNSNINIYLGKKDDNANLLTVFVIKAKSENDNLAKWIPFGNEETIETILAEFANESGFRIKAYCLGDDLITNDDFLVCIEDGEMENFIVLIDAFSLDRTEFRNFAAVIDKSPVGAILIPLCALLSDNQKESALKNISETFTRLYRHFFTRYSRAYIHLELCIPTKKILFRRLSNIAIEKLKRRPHRNNVLETKFEQRMNIFNIPDTKDIN